MVADTKVNPSFPNVDLGIQYLAWTFNTIIAGNYYYANYVRAAPHINMSECMQLIDSPIPKISADKLASIIVKSAQTFITLDDINDAALKLESDNITIDFMDLFIPDLSVSHSTLSKYFYDFLSATVYNDDGVVASFPYLVLTCYTSTSTGTIHFSPLCPSSFPDYSGIGTNKVYDSITSTDEYKNFRLCLK